MEVEQLFPRASRDFIDLNRGPQASFMEHGNSHGALAKKKTKESHSGKYVVRVTSYRVRLCDEDNLCEKFHVDACRYAGLLPSDAPNKAHIEVYQKKVANKKQEKTLIEIWQEKK